MSERNESPAAQDREWVEFPCGHRWQGVFRDPPTSCPICEQPAAWIDLRSLLIQARELAYKLGDFGIGGELDDLVEDAEDKLGWSDPDAHADAACDRETISGG